MANAEARLEMVLTAFGLPHVMGYLPTQTGESCKPLGPVGLVEAADEMSLAGVELPLPLDADGVASLHAALRERDIMIVVDLPIPLNSDPQKIRECLKTSAALGAKVVRATMSVVLCGDRRKLTGGWDAHLSGCAAQLRAVLPYAKELGLAIAVENHQDATSDDLLHLHELVHESPAYGVTLDAGNPLAVGEGPVEFAQRIAHLIRHIHLKDYTIHFAPEGYRLVRCVAGQGVIDFAALLSIVRSNGHDVLPGVEIAAQPTRTIPLLDPDWWACYPQGHPNHLIPALRILWAKGRPMNEPYGSTWERGGDSASVCAEEWEVVRKSVEFFRGLNQATMARA